jgi:hypothetical protein
MPNFPVNIKLLLKIKDHTCNSGKFKATLVYIVRFSLKKIKGWRCSSVIELLPSTCKALGSISSTAKIKYVKE